ncbi:histidine kinase dimerization/phosphoacceptor domain -containing protein [Salipiger sp.]|uniref:histidine kinase dimerization/phosphoacceptor domain -containing protein n=1 Tax=Salipiger sp. TaxID=2078585 RepID=UPI003A9855BB
MVKASVPENESERLAELHSFGVLDSGPDPALEEMVELIATLLDVPVVLISLVDENRQWFKAHHGFEASETPLDQSICSHAILNNGILEIEDTLKDERSASNPLCCGLLSDMRFYAGAPLVTRSGHPIGTLCVLDTRPRKLPPEHLKLLEVMAGQVVRQLDLERALKLKEALRSEIDHRVKNSLQTVASTIRLYRAQAESQETREYLDAIARRVNAISQLHAELNMTSKMHHLRLDAYLGRVAALLQQQAPAGLKVRTASPKLEVESRVAAAVGVIVNEFAANAMKYAFPGKGEGAELVFSVQRTGANRMTLICRDNGSGTVQDIRAEDVLASTSLGARLMKASAAQVGGTLSQGRGPDGFVLEADLPMGPDVSQDDERRAAPAAE